MQDIDSGPYGFGFPPEIRDRLRIEFNEGGGFNARLIGVYEVTGEYSSRRLVASGDDPEQACRTLVHSYENLKNEDRLDIQF